MNNNVGSVNLSKKVNYSDRKNSINLTFDMRVTLYVQYVQCHMREYHYANNNQSSQH